MAIGPFKGENRWLSNFWEAPIVCDGVTYPTSEHMYQLCKTADIDQATAIFNAPTAGKAKRLGKDSTLRDNWDDLKLSVMLKANLLKFTQHPPLAVKLLSTGIEELVEYNHWHDNFWGQCICENCEDVVGENHLGRILMSIREHLGSLYDSINVEPSEA